LAADPDRRYVLHVGLDPGYAREGAAQLLDDDVRARALITRLQRDENAADIE